MAFCVGGLSIHFHVSKNATDIANDLNVCGDRNFKITGSEKNVSKIVLKYFIEILSLWLFGMISVQRSYLVSFVQNRRNLFKFWWPVRDTLSIKDSRFAKRCEKRRETEAEVDVQARVVLHLALEVVPLPLPRRPLAGGLIRKWNSFGVLKSSLLTKKLFHIFN